MLSQTKSPQFESIHYRNDLSAVIFWLMPSVREAGWSGREELKMSFPFPCCPVNRECDIERTNQIEKKIDSEW